jgi:hypothetical protein
MVKTTTTRNAEKLMSAAKAVNSYSTNVTRYSTSGHQLTSKMVSGTPYTTVGASSNANRERYLSTSSSKQDSYRALNSVLTGSKTKFR